MAAMHIEFCFFLAKNVLKAFYSGKNFGLPILAR